MGLVTKNELECDRCGESFELDGSVALAAIVEHSGFWSSVVLTGNPTLSARTPTSRRFGAVSF